MKALHLCICITLGLASFHVRAECIGGKAMIDERKAKLSQLSIDLLNRYLNQKPTCSAFGTLVRQLAGEERRMGFRLEDPRAPDVKAAQADLDKALRDPEVKSRLDAAARSTIDPGMRLALEAGVLDDEGYYGARDLKIATLREQLK